MYATGVKSLERWASHLGYGRGWPLEIRPSPCGLPCRFLLLIIERYEHTYAGNIEPRVSPPRVLLPPASRP